MSRRGRKFVGGRALAGSAGALLLASCVSTGIQSPLEPGAAPRQGLILISPEQEQQLGDSTFKELKTSRRVSTDAAKRATVERITRRLVPFAETGVSQWECVVFEDATPNAFALPGGKIGVHTGLFDVAGSEGGLAAVIGHEIAHVALRHGGQRMTQQLGIALGGAVVGAVLQESSSRERQGWLAAYGVGTTVFAALPYSRKHEYEADRMGLIYMAKAGYDPREAVVFWKRMQQAGGAKPPEFLSTHPADDSRIAAIERLLPEALVFYQAPGAAPPPAAIPVGPR